jgi:hypothetical protein
MNSALTSVIVLSSLVAMVLVGRSVRRHLPDDHLSGDSRDTVKLAMGLVATMTALLLGLLVSSAKGTYDIQRTEVIQMAAKVAFLDRVLTAYGPEAAEARAEFRDALADAVRHMWPEEAGARAQLAPNTAVGDRVYAAIQALSPRDDMHGGLKAQAATLSVDVAELRVLLLAQSTSSVSKPMLIAVVSWLAILFLSFSLIAPPNATTSVALVAAAFSVTVAVFLILELDQPMGGMIQVSSEPMRNALHQLAK